MFEGLFKKRARAPQSARLVPNLPTTSFCSQPFRLQETDTPRRHLLLSPASDMASIAPSPTTSPMPSAASDQPAPSCTTAVPGQYGNVPSDACNSNYNFDPQYIPAVVVAIIFGILSAVHIAEAAIFKKV